MRLVNAAVLVQLGVHYNLRSSGWRSSLTPDSPVIANVAGTFDFKLELKENFNFNCSANSNSPAAIDAIVMFMDCFTASAVAWPFVIASLTYYSDSHTAIPATKPVTVVGVM